MPDASRSHSQQTGLHPHRSRRGARRHGGHCRTRRALARPVVQQLQGHRAPEQRRARVFGRREQHGQDRGQRHAWQRQLGHRHHGDADDPGQHHLEPRPHARAAEKRRRLDGRRGTRLPDQLQFGRCRRSRHARSQHRRAGLERRIFRHEHHDRGPRRGASCERRLLPRAQPADRLRVRRVLLRIGQLHARGVPELRERESQRLRCARQQANRLLRRWPHEVVRARADARRPGHRLLRVQRQRADRLVRLHHLEVWRGVRAGPRQPPRRQRHHVDGLRHLVGNRAHGQRRALARPRERERPESLCREPWHRGPHRDGRRHVLVLRIRPEHAVRRQRQHHHAHLIRRRLEALGKRAGLVAVPKRRGLHRAELCRIHRPRHRKPVQQDLPGAHRRAAPAHRQTARLRVRPEQRLVGTTSDAEQQHLGGQLLRRELPRRHVLPDPQHRAAERLGGHWPGEPQPEPAELLWQQPTVYRCLLRRLQPEGLRDARSRQPAAPAEQGQGLRDRLCPAVPVRIRQHRPEGTGLHVGQQLRELRSVRLRERDGELSQPQRQARPDRRGRAPAHGACRLPARREGQRQQLRAHHERRVQHRADARHRRLDGCELHGRSHRQHLRRCSGRLLHRDRKQAAQHQREKRPLGQLGRLHGRPRRLRRLQQSAFQLHAHRCPRHGCHAFRLDVPQQLQRQGVPRRNRGLQGL